MSLKVGKISLAVSSLVVTSTLSISSTVTAQTNLEEITPLTNNYTINQPAEAIEQINQVHRLQDVSPSDWSYQALRSLVERYGCIVGLPDLSYRGNQSISRYEFAAGLNSCLNQWSRLFIDAEHPIFHKGDLETLQRLIK